MPSSKYVLQVAWMETLEVTGPRASAEEQHPGVAAAAHERRPEHVRQPPHRDYYGHANMSQAA